jgi:hypothetical protein
MKMFTATVILAAAALGAPVAVGQSQGELGFSHVTARAQSFEPLQPFRQAATRSSPTGNAPSPAVSWLMALGFLGFVVMRRTRAPLP